MLILFFTIILLLPPAFAQPIIVEFTDNTPAPIQENSNLLVNQRLITPANNISAYRIQQLAFSISGLIEEAAQPFGYFSTSCSVKNIASKPRLIFRASCKMNQPVRIHSVKISISGPGKYAVESKLSSKQVILQKNQVFQAIAYESTKAQLIELANRLGYVNATTQSSTLKIDPSRYTADAHIKLETGNLYSFGDTLIDQNIYSQSFLRSMSPFKTGTAYDDQLLSLYKENLESSSLFTYVSVLPLSANTQSQTIPMHISYEPIAKLQYGIGAGYSSDSDFFYSTTIQRNRLTNRGTRLVSELFSSADYSYAISTLSVPRTHPTKDYFNLQLGYQRQKIDYVGTDRSTTTSLSHIKQHRVSDLKNIRRELSLNYSIDRSKLDNENTSKIQFLYPSFQYDISIHSANNNLNVLLQNGVKANLKALVSPTDFVRFFLQQKLNYSFNQQKKHIFQFKSQQGYISTANSGDPLPLAWYFYTGGAYSVRGFSYNSIGADPNVSSDYNNVLYTVSLELQRSLFKDFYWIIFADLGGAAVQSSLSPPSYAVGTGILWKTFAGNLEVSLAKPIRNDSSDPSMEPRLNINIYQPL